MFVGSIAINLALARRRNLYLDRPRLLHFSVLGVDLFRLPICGLGLIFDIFGDRHL